MKFITRRFYNHQRSIQAFFGIIMSTFFVLTAKNGTHANQVIDLLKAMNLHVNASQYGGVSITQGIHQKIAFKLYGTNRKLILPKDTYHQAANLLKQNSDFTFAGIIRQKESNSGSIISFSHGYNRYLELQSSGRRNEIRFHFAYVTSDNELMVHTESFSFHLADNNWHKIALVVSGTQLQLIIDCNVIYTRVTSFVPDRNFSASSMQLLIGQRNLNGHSLFKGDFQEIHMVPGAYGYLALCNNMNTMCPTCGQFQQLQNIVYDFGKKMSTFKKIVDNVLKRIENLEKCDCKKSCVSNDNVKEDGEVWNIGCKECRCTKGIVTCKKIECRPLKCKHPVQHKGECCSKCLRNCYINKRDFEHGEKAIIGCNNCSCIDGAMKCDKIICPKLQCPVEKQITVSDECCKYCPGADYCAMGHNCHVNATCLNLNTKYLCICNSGLQGDGFTCIDIDECMEKGGRNGNYCQLNTKCVNKLGSYECECLNGYKRLDKYNCVEIDECKSNQHSCHENADCINTIGSYDCRCKEGYTGNGYECEPICNQSCLNGGQCVYPGVCSCTTGYTGKSCEKDINECLTNFHGCKNTSYCVNMPGWYYCKCKPGYELRNNDCFDIDECLTNTHTCHPTANCINKIGSYECSCKDFSLNINFHKPHTLIENQVECKNSCIFESNEILHDTRVSPRNQPCKSCLCLNGVIHCEDPVCDCNVWKNDKRRELCCPQCDPKESCQHQELKHIRYQSGERWIYQCQICECLYGELDCWKLECPPITCKDPLAGDCCRHCPEDVSLCDTKNLTNAISKPCFYERNFSESLNPASSKSCESCNCQMAVLVDE